MKQYFKYKHYTMKLQLNQSLLNSKFKNDFLQMILQKCYLLKYDNNKLLLLYHHLKIYKHTYNSKVINTNIPYVIFLGPKSYQQVFR